MLVPAIFQLMLLPTRTLLSTVEALGSFPPLLLASSLMPVASPTVHGMPICTVSHREHRDPPPSPPPLPTVPDTRSDGDQNLRAQRCVGQKFGRKRVPQALPP